MSKRKPKGFVELWFYRTPEGNVSLNGQIGVLLDFEETYPPFYAREGEIMEKMITRDALHGKLQNTDGFLLKGLFFLDEKNSTGEERYVSLVSLEKPQPYYWWSNEVRFIED